MRPSFNKNRNRNLRDKKITKSNDVYSSNRDEHSAVSNPINDTCCNNQIISGYFLNEKPYKEMIISRVNNFLYALLGFLVLFCLVCYYFVSCKEVQLNKISRETLELNYENEELQNKVDSLQSYYNIDKAVSSANILERAKQVVEVNEIKLPSLNFNKNTTKSRKSLVVSY